MFCHLTNQSKRSRCTPRTPRTTDHWGAKEAPLGRVAALVRGKRSLAQGVYTWSKLSLQSMELLYKSFSESRDIILLFTIFTYNFYLLHQLPYLLSPSLLFLLLIFSRVLYSKAHFRAATSVCDERTSTTETRRLQWSSERIKKRVLP